MSLSLFLIFKRIEHRFIFEPVILLLVSVDSFTVAKVHGSREVNLFDGGKENESLEVMTSVIDKASEANMIVFRRDDLVLV